MFVNVNQIQIGIANFIENEIASKATGFQKFATYFILQRINGIIANYINAFKSNEFMKDLFNSNGDVDIDALYNMCKKAIQKSGQFEIAGVILGETDIDKIYSYIRNTTV
jgi:hypothetical protein